MPLSFEDIQLQDLPRVAARLIEQRGNIFLFTGQLGAGKTTLIKEMCRQLGGNAEMSSPSFSLVNEYLSDQGPIYHMDLYRINSEQEALDLGLTEYLESGYPCLVEWPEVAENILQEYDAIVVQIEDSGAGGRRIFVREHALD